MLQQNATHSCPSKSYSTRSRYTENEQHFRRVFGVTVELSSHNKGDPSRIYTMLDGAQSRPACCSSLLEATNLFALPRKGQLISHECISIEPQLVDIVCTSIPHLPLHPHPPRLHPPISPCSPHHRPPTAPVALLSTPSIDPPVQLAC